jgi:F1F0 ATPase subunit 2
MKEWIEMVLVFMAGLALGAMFFLGLWYTVQKATTSKAPALWVLGSFLFRVGIVMLGFYYIGVGNWQKLLVCLAGFIVARFAVTYYTKPKEVVKQRKEVHHEA